MPGDCARLYSMVRISGRRDRIVRTYSKFLAALLLFMLSICEGRGDQDGRAGVDSFPALLVVTMLAGWCTVGR